LLIDIYEPHLSYIEQFFNHGDVRLPLTIYITNGKGAKSIRDEPPPSKTKKP